MVVAFERAQAAQKAAAVAHFQLRIAETRMFARESARQLSLVAPPMAQVRDVLTADRWSRALRAADAVDAKWPSTPTDLEPSLLTYLYRAGIPYELLERAIRHQRRADVRAADLPYLLDVAAASVPPIVKAG